MVSPRPEEQLSIGRTLGSFAGRAACAGAALAATLMLSAGISTQEPAAHPARAPSITPPQGTAATEQPAADQPEHAAKQPLDFQDQPYRIKVLVSFAHDSRLNDRLRADVLRRFRSHADLYVGPSWQLDVEDSSARLAIPSADAIGALSAAAVAPLAADQDKIFVLGVRSLGDRFLLAAREYDVYFDRWGAVFEAAAREPGQVARELLVMAANMFSPLGHLESGDAKRVRIRVRGGRLPGFNPRATDPEAKYKPSLSHQFVQSRALFRPMRPIESEDREQIIGYRPLGWTFYEVERRDGSLYSCRVDSALTIPLPPPAQDPSEPQLIAARTAGGSTRLRLVHRDTKFPLSAIDVEVREAPDAASIPLGTTDLDGAIHVPPSRLGVGRPVRVFIRHGRDLLAQLPVLPGAGEEPDLALRPDDLRLDIEGRVVAFQEQIIDEVAKRTILAGSRDATGAYKGGLVRKAIQKKDWKQAEDLLKQLKQSPDQESLKAKLDQTRQYAISLREWEKQTGKVKRMFRETEDIIDLYCATEDLEAMVDDLDSELNDARSEAAAAAAEDQARSPPGTSG
jgi:hypothetical protein